MSAGTGRKSGRFAATSTGLMGAAAGVLSASSTGINRWWVYEEHGIPGVGKAYANINTGNMLISVTDIDIPERGIDLALRRTYNSMSQHDASNDDGTNPGVFGNGWTSTFDAHISSPDGTTISIWDADGGRYDFDCSPATLSSNNNVCANLTAGDHNELYPDPNNTGTGGVSCTWAWQKRNGSVYEFYQLGAISGCSQYAGGAVPPALYGALGKIFARNNNNYLTFGYSFTGGDGSSLSNLAQMTVAHSDNDYLLLTFGSAGQDLGITTPTELMTIAFYRNNAAVAGEQLAYGYDTLGNLLEVDHPANNTGVQETFISPLQKVLPETYVVYPYTDTPSSPPTYQFACGPRYYIGGGQVGGGSATDGACLKFSFGGQSGAGPNQLTEWHTVGIANFAPQSCATSTSVCHNAYGNNGDTTGALLQSGVPSGWQTIDDAKFLYAPNALGNQTCTNATAISTCVYDTDGHVTYFDLDASGPSSRVIATHTSTGNGWLYSQQTWSTASPGPYSNNILSSTDPRGHTTYYAYDPNGNTVAVAQPVVSSIGNYRPTGLYAYDSFHNVTAYCDPIKTQAMGDSWPASFTASPSPATCSSAAPNSADGIAVYKWRYPAYEPSGELTDTYKPMGYHVNISYSTSDDYGLPILVSSDVVTQDNSRHPGQSFSYDSYGNLITYNPAAYATPNPSTLATPGPWQIQYDSANRVIMREDPDTVSSYTCFYPDGSVQFTETAYQHALDGGATLAPDCNDASTPYAVNYNYDGDGDPVTESHAHGGTYVPGASATPQPGGTSARVKYYDGLDRLVEVVEPHDSASDIYHYAWMTRYLYDLTQGGNAGSISFASPGGSKTYLGYGNLYKTQEYIPAANKSGNYASPGSVTDGGWRDVKGQAFDAADRMTNKYAVVQGGLNIDTLTYDANTLDNDLDGQLATQCNQLSQCQLFDYDSRGALITFQSSDGSAPQRNYLHDLDGRVTSIASASQYSTPQTYTYDLDGNKLTSTDPKGGQYESAGGSTITHEYYTDGKLQYVDVSGGVLSQTHLLSYHYQDNGDTAAEIINDSSVLPAVKHPGATTVTYGYSPGGRLEHRTETGVSANAATTTTVWGIPDQSLGHLGMLVQQTLPQTTLKQYQYSPEGETLGLTSTAQYYATLSNATWTYNVRGEVTSSPPTLAFGSTEVAYSTSQTMYANGTAIQIPTGTHGGGRGYPITDSVDLISWDVTMGVPLEVEYDATTPTKTVTTTDSTWTYDSAGRMKKDHSAVTPTGGGWNVPRTFDAENHEIDGGSVVWGPNGHPMMISTGSASAQTLHWDGDQLLFTTELQGAKGVLVDIKVGPDGDITPADATYNDLTFYDRGPGGQVVGCHNKSGTSYLGLSNSATAGFGGSAVCTTDVSSGGLFPQTIMWSTSPCPGGGCGTLTTTILPGTVLGMPRRDGYAWGFGTFQGGRTFDSDAGTWTTPDAYAGDVQDPMSQKSYMWNGNDPVKYTDPSGYVADVSTHPDPADSTQTDVSVTLHVKFNGAGDTPAAEAAIINSIETHWSGTFGSYHVTTTVTTDNSGVTADHVNTISISAGDHDNFHVDQINNHMMVGASDGGNGWGFAHEAGHLMGLPDMYDSMRTMPLSHQPNPNFGNPWPGHAGDMMATHGGSVTPYDIGRILASPANFVNTSP